MQKPMALNAWHDSFERLGLRLPVRAQNALRVCAVWNLAVSGAPFWRPREAPAANSFRDVRSANHTPPRLPSVKDLADDIDDFYN